MEDDNNCDNNAVLDFLKRATESASGIASWKTQYRLFDSVNASVEKSFGEIFLMCLKYSLAARSPFSEIVNLMKLINIICEKKNIT